MTDSQTIPDVHSIARDQLRAFVQRVERIEEEIKTLNDDKSDIYKEAAAVGFDKKTLKKVVARRKVDDNQRQEEDALFDMYWDAVHGTNLVHARVRENIEEFDAETGEILEDRRSDAGLNIVTKHTEITASSAEAAVTADDDLREPVAAEQGQIIREGDAPRETDRFGGDASCPDTEFQMDRATEGSFETGSEAAEKGREAIPAGPEGVDLSHAGAGESPATASKPKVSFRPNCLQPEMCRSGTRDHCYSCRKAMAQHEDAA